jgi:predicted nucleotidyltransferase
MPSAPEGEDAALAMNLKEILRTLTARLGERGVQYALSGGVALGTLGIFRFTNDLDFVVLAEAKKAVDEIMRALDYERQDFSTEEIVSYVSPLKVFGQVDFLLARRRYSRAMLQRARLVPLFDGELRVRTLLPEDVIGLKVQAIHNDPRNRVPVDAPDIQRILDRHRLTMDMARVREYFELFGKEALLDEWLADLERGGKAGDA